jgi:hypothetical protein
MNNIDIDQILSEVEQEVTKAFGKSEETQEEVQNETETEETVEMNKSQEEESAEESSFPYSEQDMQTITSIYSEMSKSEMEAHYNSIKKALFGESTESSMEKSEEQKVETEKETNEEEISLIKSEIEKTKAENEELKKSLSITESVIQSLFESIKTKAPERKALTGVGYIAKSEETVEKNIDLSKLSKGEITGKLKGLDYSSLSKSDRDAINDYYLNSGSVEKIKHLILE